MNSLLVLLALLLPLQSFAYIPPEPLLNISKRSLDGSWFLWSPPCEKTIITMPEGYHLSRNDWEVLSYAIQLDDPLTVERILPAEKLLKINWRFQPSPRMEITTSSVFGGVVLEGKIRIARYIFSLPQERTRKIFEDYQNHNERLLHLAILSRNEEMIRLVLDHFPTFKNQRDHFHGTPLNVAERLRNPSISEGVLNLLRPTHQFGKRAIQENSQNAHSNHSSKQPRISDEWVEVLPVEFPKGQKGLFARKDIPEGTILGVYEGKIYSASELKIKVPHPEDYLNYVENGYFYDVEHPKSKRLRFSINGFEPEPGKTEKCLAAYANHSKRNNATFADTPVSEYDFGSRPPGYTVAQGYGVVLVATDFIPKGKEVLVNYGKAYSNQLKAKYPDADIDNIQCRFSNKRLNLNVAQEMKAQAERNYHKALWAFEPNVRSQASLEEFIQETKQAIEMAEDAYWILSDSGLNEKIKRMYDKLKEVEIELQRFTQLQAGGRPTRIRKPSIRGLD